MCFCRGTLKLAVQKPVNDTELSNAFADFFVKIERIRREIARGRSANGMTKTTTAVNYLSYSCVSEFKFLEPLMFNRVTRF